MTVFGCQMCGRSISVSYSPEGNPVALADPEHWAIVFAVCNNCGKHFCDRCIGNSQQCPKCGGSITMHRPGDGYAWEIARQLEGAFEQHKQPGRKSFFSRLFKRD